MKAGLLIIGSLLWDNDHRARWRQHRLSLVDLVHVKVPIRYGRSSSSRGNTFTMTFNSDGELGQAVLVPCRFDIKDVASLVAEAEALWQAEQASAAANSIGVSWGCVGILFRNEEVWVDLLTAWTQHFRASKVSPIPPVDCDGKLHIPWPVTSDSAAPVGVDIILATATQPAQHQPTVSNIADSWIYQTDGYERYFIENIRHGIRTPEDVHIWKRIEKKSPCWLNFQDYSEVVTLLRAEANLSV